MKNGMLMSMLKPALSLIDESSLKSFAEGIEKSAVDYAGKFQIPEDKEIVGIIHRKDTELVVSTCSIDENSNIEELEQHSLKELLVTLLKSLKK